MGLDVMKGASSQPTTPKSGHHLRKVSTRNGKDLEMGGYSFPSPTPSHTTSSAPALVLSNSGKRMDQTGNNSRKKYVKQVTERHNDMELHLTAQRGDLVAVRMILGEIDEQMMRTGVEFDADVAEIRTAMVNELNEMGDTALLIAVEKGKRRGIRVWIR